MSVRLIELYKEASEFAYKICREEGRNGGTSDHIWNMLSTGKFAELIVKECIDIAYKEGDNVAYLALHFGVEELIKKHVDNEQNKFICPKCGVDRFLVDCPNPNRLECGIKLDAQ